MDQGFAPQGFSSNDVGSIGRALKTRAPGEVEIAGKTASTAKRGAARTADGAQQEVAKLQGYRSFFMLPANWELFGLLGGGAGGWATKKLGWQRVSATIGMVARAPVQAIRTPITDFFKIPANFFKAAGQEASNAGEKAAGMAERANAKATAWEQTGARAESRAAASFEPYGKSIGAGIARFEQSGVGKAFHGMFDRVMQNKNAAAIRRHDTGFVNVRTALTTEASTGFGASIKNFISRKVMRKTAPTVDVGELSSIMHGIEGAKGDATALKTVAAQLETMIADGSLSAEAKARADIVAKHVGKLVGSAHAMETYSSAAGGSLKSMLGAMAKSAGRVSVFSALIGVGVTFGVGATMVAANAESKESKAAFADLSSQLGASDSGFLEAVKQAQKKQGMWGVAKTGMRLVGDVADGAMWMMPGGGGMAMMTAMMLPQLCESLVPGNPTLGAFVAIGKDDSGALKLDRDARIQAIRNLVAVMPAVAAKGGFYNHLAQPIAAEIVERNLTAPQVVELFGSNAAFTQLSREVADKTAQKGAAAAKAKVSNDNEAVHPAAHQAQMAMSSAEAAYRGAAKPMSKVAANDVQLDGKAVGAQLQVG